MLIFVALLAFGVSTGLHASEQTKTLPGFTVFDKDGEYLKFIGPLYGVFKVEVTSPPVSLTSVITANATLVPTLDILSIFLNGTVLFEGRPIYFLDGDKDECYKFKGCPLLKSKKHVFGYTVKLIDTGLVPGWYEGTIDIRTFASGGMLRIAGIKFKIKFRNSS